MDGRKFPGHMKTKHNRNNPPPTKKTAQIHKTTDLYPYPVAYARQWKE